ncbi:MAG: PKD domain-containing protein, partial [Pirellulaceae bacterium]|nr:PKD domain-containing protein [Pirellulaceae bacterium]
TIQSVTNDGPVDEGSPATVTITATDPAGSNDPLTYEWDFDNDGTYEQASSSNTATHTYADNGTYTVKVTVTDDDGGSDTEQFQVTVQNVDPSLSVVGNQTVAEGSLLSIPDIGTFTDPAFHDMPLNNTKTFSYSIAWDDGTAADTGGATIDAMGSRGTATQGSFNGSHICADNGTYTVVVTVTDDDGGSDTEQFQVTVTNVAPTVDAGEDVLVLEARTLVSSGSFTDPGDDLWEGTVDYGDGSGVQPLTLNADKSFALHHVYATYGTYTVTVTVMDDDGGWHSDTMQAHVGLNLTMPIEPDVAGWTMFTAFNATPGGLVVFVLGVQPGAGQVKVKGQSPVEVEIQAPKVVAQAVVDSSGKAVAMIDLFKYADQTVYLQAFEQKPVRQISDRMTIDVPPLPTLEIADEKVDESAGSITFTVTLKLASDREVRVNYATANGTAGSRYDYTTKRGTLKIPAGATSGQIIVPIKNDTKHEEPEVFYVNLSRPKNATLADNQATGTIWDDDPVALRLAAAAGRRTAADALSAAQLAAVTDEAIRRWAAAVGDDAVAGLYAVNWELADLPDNLLGRASANTVSIDRDAAGRGWFVDASPWNDDEFLTTHAADELRARRGGAAADRVDLLTAVMHELGHVLGLPDVTGRSDDLMSDSLGLGLRRLP